MKLWKYLDICIELILFCRQINILKFGLQKILMSNQIQDLIANIEQKFDDEFKQPNKSSNPNKNKLINKDNPQEHHNPETEKQGKMNIIKGKINEKKAQEIVIEDDQEHQETGHQNQVQFMNCKRQQHRSEEDESQPQSQEEEYVEEEGQNKYRDLSHKLQTALKKISSGKSDFQTMTGAQSAALFARFQDYESKREKDLQMKRQIQEQKKYHGLKSKPDINAKSKQIAQETSYKPIYARFEHILSEKKKKMQQNQENKKQREEQKYEQFMDEYRKHAKIQPQECRNIDTYFNDMIAWKNKLNKERDEKLKQKQQKQKEGYTFKPELNQKSMRMLKNQKRVPIHDREIERPKTQQCEYTFQPKINKRRVK